MNTKELVEISYFIDKIEEESSLYKDTECDSEKLYKIINVLRDSISSNKQFEKSRELIRVDLNQEDIWSERLFIYSELCKIGYQISMLDGKIFMLKRDLLQLHLENLAIFHNQTKNV
jgi:hypothetical protein